MTTARPLVLGMLICLAVSPVISDSRLCFQHVAPWWRRQTGLKPHQSRAKSSPIWAKRDVAYLTSPRRLRTIVHTHTSIAILHCSHCLNPMLMALMLDRIANTYIVPDLWELLCSLLSQYHGISCCGSIFGSPDMPQSSLGNLRGLSQHITPSPTCWNSQMGDCL